MSSLFITTDRSPNFQALYSGATDRKEKFVHVMYLLELLEVCDYTVITPAHAYQFASLHYNVEKTECKELWVKYLNQYKPEISKEVMTAVVCKIHDLVTSFNSLSDTMLSISIGKDLYDMIKESPKYFACQKANPYMETIDLTLRQYDISDANRSGGEYIFTVKEIKDIFSQFINEVLSGTDSEEDLKRKNSPTARKYYITYLSIMYRLFKPVYQDKHAYWYTWEQIYLNSNKTNMYQDIISTVPVRTPEAVLCWSGNERFLQKSLEQPVQINGPVDRYLSYLFS